MGPPLVFGQADRRAALSAVCSGRQRQNAPPLSRQRQNAPPLSRQRQNAQAVRSRTGPDQTRGAQRFHSRKRNDKTHGAQSPLQNRRCQQAAFHWSGAACCAAAPVPFASPPTGSTAGAFFLGAQFTPPSGGRSAARREPCGPRLFSAVRPVRRGSRLAPSVSLLTIPPETEGYIPGRPAVGGKGAKKDCRFELHPIC